ncbi:RICIN domain-containing protein [Streptomyces sp. CA-111067]|uniref:RICIN domain-containing protein n=1 Tax=Streptomyces sp. CA-111067 TaxID=3240046 RepID=UPI003D99C6A2
MKLRYALAAAAAVALATGGSVTSAAATAAPSASGSTASQGSATSHNVPGTLPTSGVASKSAGAPGAASASATSSWNQEFQEYLYGYCLDDSAGVGLRLTTCSSTSYANGYQKWTVTEDGLSYKFKNGATNLCLDGSAGNGIVANTCSTASYNNGYQKWVQYYADFSQYGNAWIDWKNVATGQCMDYSLGDHLKLKPCSAASFNNGYQKWNISTD